ncbi:WD40/YVTN/BNR-like repeat-containing protein [Paenibacillus macerans]|uniref:WD40/YVTN/BNR-like repeat-containing protein n=1 Tax=Paenibacillus macerans TaxID=44252 RepID=UPI003D315B17
MWRKFAGPALVFALLLTACTSEPPPAPTAALQDEPPEEGQTITVINRDGAENQGKPAATPAEEGQNQYQIQTRLTDFQLLSATTGIAWGCTRNELRLYITQDNGKTWANISPAASVHFPATPQYGKDIFFIDLNHGWIVRNSAGSGDTIVLRTTDGGTTWKVASFPETVKVTAMFFADQSNGWVLSGAGGDSRALFTTDNGGMSFEALIGGENASSLFTSERPVSVIPLTDASMAFTNSQQGFVSEIKDQIPALYVTQDGGLTWSANEQYFNLDKYKTCDRFTLGKVSFFSGNKREGWIPIGCSRGNSTKFNGYFTEDAGKTWTMVPFKLSWQTGMNEEFAPTFLNDQEGWTILDSTVYYTSDQGNSWDALPESKKLQQIMADYPEIVKLQFFSSRVGWLLVAKEDQQRSLLLQTQDGGRSWHVL